ncbi:hypothetical protein QYE76_043736 [Lolium multiflorum]|uniref:Zinc knuckle CX2CX4HX4C domain-containing protein n=1 Tax=Lolium multiflorum TaxID=4521 RepID=A0AAD8TJ95_LOLMU|nr:hypothetical protein QYE76_043736 [Lolium multiflorum]
MASPTSSAASQTGEGSGSKEERLDDLLQRLGIDEEEIDDLVFEEEADAPKEGIKWMALAKVHSMNFFSPQTFEQHMRFAWSPAREVKFRSLENNLFTIQCFCLGDWLKITKGGPWLFRQNAVTIEEYDGLVLPESIDLNFLVVWVQVHKLPDGYRGETLVKNLIERKVGSDAVVDKTPHGLGDFIRVRVKLDLRKPLARFVTISRAGQREFFKIQFEKIPRFCGACGMVGHIHLECGTGEHDESKLKWGDFLKAERETWHGRVAFGVNRGRGRGRSMDGRGRFAGGGRNMEPHELVVPGRGRGPAFPISWRHNAIRPGGDLEMDDNLKDTATSPVKGLEVVMTDENTCDPGAKRRLNMSLEIAEKEHEQSDTDKGAPAAMLVDGTGISKEPHPEVTDTDRKKRSKKEGANSTSLGSAGSLEEPVRSQ